MNHNSKLNLSTTWYFLGCLNVIILFLKRKLWLNLLDLGHGNARSLSSCSKTELYSNSSRLFEPLNSALIILQKGSIYFIVFQQASNISLETYHLSCGYTVYQGFLGESHLLDLNYLIWFVLPVLQRLNQSL